MSQTSTVLPLSGALKLTVARAMLVRHHALSRALAEAVDRSAKELSSDPGIARIEAEHDQKVLSAVKAYRHSGGSVFDHMTVLPPLLENESRPDPNQSLQAMFEFKGVPLDAARIDAEVGPKKARCTLDGRYQVPVLTFLRNYFRLPESEFQIKPLAEFAWTLPDLPDEKAASMLLARQPPRKDSYLGQML